MEALAAVADEDVQHVVVGEDGEVGVGVGAWDVGVTAVLAVEAEYAPKSLGKEEHFPGPHEDYRASR